MRRHGSAIGRAAVVAFAVGFGWVAGCADDYASEQAAEPDTTYRSAPPDTASGSDDESDDNGQEESDTGREGEDPESGPDTGEASEEDESTVDTGTDGPGGGDTDGRSDSGSSGDGGPPEVLRLIAMGDTGEGNDAQVRVAKGVQNRCDRAGGCHGFIMLGDNIYDTGPDSPEDMQFDTKVDQPYRRLKYGAPPPDGQPDDRRRMPIYVSLGNHDLGGAGLESQLIQHYLDYAEQREWFYYPEEYWDKQIGNVHLISIHTNPLAYLGTKTEPQAQLVQDALSETTADWTIVFGHHPYRSNGSHGNAGSYEDVPGDLTPFGGEYREWVNEHVCDRVDFLVTGHDHNRQWINPMPEMSGEVLGGGDGDDVCETHMPVSGAGAKTRGMEDNDNDLAFGKPTLGFLLMEFHDTKVEVEYADADGKTEWSKTIRK